MGMGSIEDATAAASVIDEIITDLAAGDLVLTTGLLDDLAACWVSLREYGRDGIAPNWTEV